MDEITAKKLLGQRIKELRKSQRLTQTELGNRIGINQRQIAHIEGGKSFPSFTTLIKITNNFKCDLKYLFEFECKNYPKNISSEINKKIKNMDDEQLKMVYQLVDIVSNNL